jgi:branched-chain amino acid aminotransferase
MASQRRIWLNGRPGPADSPGLAVTDRGFRFGDGVFEVFRARRGVLIEWPHHAARLREGAAALAIAFPWADGELADWCRALLEAEGLAGAGGRAGIEPGDAVLRITVSRGPRDEPGLAPGDDGSAPTVVVEAWPYGAPPPRALDQGVATIEAAGRRDPAAPLAGVRSLSCADRVAAQLQAARAGADDGLLLTPDGCLVESTSACVFTVRDTRLVTPPLAAGVEPRAIRAWLLRDPAARAIGLAPTEAALRPADLLAADEAFLADDVAGIVPLVTHDGQPIGGGRPGLRTLALRAAREAWIDRVSRGEVVDAAATPGIVVPAAEPAAAEPAGAEPEAGGRPLEPATLPEGITEAASVHVAVPTRSSLLARSAALPSSERAALGPDQVYGWAAALAPAEVLLLGRVVHEMLRTGSPPEAGRAFGIAWWGGARLPRHDQESMIREFADLEVTIGSVLAGRDLRDVRPAPKRGLAALFDFLPSRTRESESQAFSAIELAGEPAHLGLIALWNAWVAVRYRALIPPPTFEMLIRPWVTVVGPLPGP